MIKTFKTIDISYLGEKHSGKVRDYYVVEDKRILITTDRISAFDQILGEIPYKGQVLNLLSAFWFEKTADIIPSHLISTPDPNVTIAHNAIAIPIEMVVRGYITGVTGTSIWGSYEKGERVIYGITLPDGLKKNDKLPSPIITPTTKAEVGHDARLTRNEIITNKIVPEKIYEQMEKTAVSLFLRGQEIAQKAGFILVDTKYEFGLLDNKLIIIDEIHTPDSSRFWIQKTYQERLQNKEEPESFDKEYLRIWYKNRGYTGDGIPPKMTEDFIKELSKRYITIFEKITHQPFTRYPYPIEKRIIASLKNI